MNPDLIKAWMDAEEAVHRWIRKHVASREGEILHDADVLDHAALEEYAALRGVADSAYTAYLDAWRAQQG
jgi:hypothetical protein